MEGIERVISVEVRQLAGFRERREVGSAEAHKVMKPATANGVAYARNSTMPNNNAQLLLFDAGTVEKVLGPGVVFEATKRAFSLHSRSEGRGEDPKHVRRRRSLCRSLVDVQTRIRGTADTRSGCRDG